MSSWLGLILSILPSVDYSTHDLHFILFISGVGKTTTAHLVAKELGFDVMEMNASDARSKKLLDKNIADAISCASVSQSSKKRVNFRNYPQSFRDTNFAS